MMMAAESSSSSSSSSSSPSSTSASSPAASSTTTHDTPSSAIVRKKDDAYQHQKKPYPTPLVPLAPVRRKSSPWAVGFLCVLLQYWKDLDLRGGGTHPKMKSLLQALQSQLPQVSHAFKPLAVSFLLWVEQKIASFRLTLVEVPPPCTPSVVPSPPPPSPPSSPLPRSRPTTPTTTTHASLSTSSLAPVGRSGNGDDAVASNEDEEDQPHHQEIENDPSTAPTSLRPKSPVRMSSSSSSEEEVAVTQASLPSPSSHEYALEESGAACRHDKEEGFVANGAATEHQSGPVEGGGDTVVVSDTRPTSFLVVDSVDSPSQTVVDSPSPEVVDSPSPEEVARFCQGGDGTAVLNAETGFGEEEEEENGGDSVVLRSDNPPIQSVVVPDHCSNIPDHCPGCVGGSGVVAPTDRDDDTVTAAVVPAADHNAATATVGLFRDAQKRQRNNQMWIHQVLTYWFGQGTPEHLQRQLWMVPSGSPRRPLLDADIAHQFGALLVELANDTELRWSEWTGCRPGSLEEEKDDESAPLPAGGSDDEPEEGRPIHHDNNNNNNNNDDDAIDAHCVYGFHGKVAAIVVLDQFSRHIWRHQNDNPQATPIPNLPPQAELDHLAYRTAQLLARYHGPELRSGMVPIPMHIFALMPLRHANTLEAVQSVQDQIAHLDVLGRDGDAMIRRFRNATNRRLAHLQDQRRRDGDPNHSSETADADILEHSSFKACLATSRIHPIHQTITAFLADRGIHPLSKSSYLHRTPPGTPIIVSLSGGVDSMVIASVLSYLNQACHYHLHLIAVHIDYGNRPESAAEADFVRRFCADLHMEFFCRRIDEVTRGVTARDEYERISRRVRYDLYRQAAQRASEGRPEVGDVGVVLGHHRGDLRENVLSNAHRGCGPLDLSGMTAVSRNDGVTLYRPLLAVEKEAVYDYAHRFGVPYFKDTTPHWSTRGKLRNKLLPLLEEIYGEGAMTNLSTLAVESDACRSLMHGVAFGPFLDQVQHRPMGITFGTHAWKHCDMFFWKFVLREALHSAGLGMFSEKSVATFLERVQASEVREGWLQCRKDYATYVRSDGQVFVLYPASFPWSTSLSCETTHETQAIGPEHSRRIGPWDVQACVVETTEDRTATDLLARKGMSTMEHFMDGCFEYYVQARTWKADSTIFFVRPLLFTTFSKSSRPLAWKNTDAKIQEKLPLLGCDEVTRAAIDDPFGMGAVHADARGNVVANPIVLICVTLRLQSLVPFPKLLGADCEFVSREPTPRANET